MSDINETLAKLRAHYTDDEDIAKIEEDEKRLSALLDEQDYYLQPGTQRLIAQCRTDIKTARIKLATDKTIDEDTRRALWAVIDARQWFLHLVAKDYAAELAAMAEELAAELERTQ